MIPLVAGKGVDGLAALFGGILIGGLLGLLLGSLVAGALVAIGSEK